MTGMSNHSQCVLSNAAMSPQPAPKTAYASRVDMTTWMHSTINKP